jgi:hypothetical protein
MISEMVEGLDEYVARNGYGKLFTTLLATISVVTLLSALFGALWLRAATALVLVAGIVVLLLLGIAERRRLRGRIERDADTINRYVDFIDHHAPVKIRVSKQIVEIEKNGDSVITWDITLRQADDSEPHFVKASFTYYGKANLTDATRRRVWVSAYRMSTPDADPGTRAHVTYSWSNAKNGRPKHDVVVHLDGGIEEGERIVVVWHWPKYCDDLRSFRSSEIFEAFFGFAVDEFQYEIRLKECGRLQPVVNRRGIAATHGWDKRHKGDYIITFGGTHPAQGKSVGVEIDMDPWRRN